MNAQLIPFCTYCFTAKIRSTKDYRRQRHRRSRMNNKQQNWILPSNCWNELKTCAICNLLRQRRTRMVVDWSAVDWSKSSWLKGGCPAFSIPAACHIFWVQLRFPDRARTGKTAIMLDYVWKLLKKIFNCSCRKEGNWATAAVYFRLPGGKLTPDSRTPEIMNFVATNYKFMARPKTSCPGPHNSWRQFIDRNSP